MTSLVGIILLPLVAWLLSSNRRAINFRTVGFAFALQAGIGGAALFTDWGHAGLLTGIRICRRVARLQQGGHGIYVWRPREYWREHWFYICFQRIARGYLF